MRRDDVRSARLEPDESLGGDVEAGSDRARRLFVGDERVALGEHVEEAAAADADVADVEPAPAGPIVRRPVLTARSTRVTSASSTIQRSSDVVVVRWSTGHGLVQS